MDYFHEEESLGKAYDARLMRRLLAYAKPYWKLIAVSILMLLLISATELARPYVIKVAIDDHILAYDRPYRAVGVDFPDQNVVLVGSLYLLREDQFPRDYEPFGDRYQIIRADGVHYLAAGVIPSEEEVEIVVDGDGYSAVAGSQSFSAERLPGELVNNLRTYDRQGLMRLAAIFFAIIFVGFILNYIQVYILQYTGQMIVFDIRQQLFSHMERLAITFFDGNPVGRLVTRVANDTQQLHEMYTAVLVNMFRDIFMLLGIIIIMLRLNWRLALLSFAVLPLIIVVTAIFRIRARAAYREVRVKLARINANFAENINGMRIVHIFNQQRRKFREFRGINQDHFDASLRELKVFAVFRPSMDLLFSLGLALLIWFGGGRVLQGTLEFGVLYAFVNYMDQFFRPINDMTEKYNILQSAMASAERLFVIMDTEEGIPEPAKPVTLPRVEGRIEFRNVWFAYVKDDWVLRDVSFVIEPGQTCAFVGATGAGKSTIMNLITRFYDIQKGQILLDGVDIRELSKKQLRENIGLVMQDVFLFRGTIKDNIRLNNAVISDSEIEETARYVNAHSFISKLPKIYQEPVTERGSTLSAGQRQLLAFARALAFDPAVLILDEATANIDTETEALIQDALPKMLAGRTSIVVAHRLSTIQNADTIIVLHKGKIREMGNHQELLHQRGMYYKLYRLQYQEGMSVPQTG